MTIEYIKNMAIFTDICEVDEAEELRAWLLENSSAQVDLKACRHLHTSVLQVLMAYSPEISALPEDEFLKTRIVPTLSRSKQQG